MNLPWRVFGEYSPYYWFSTEITMCVRQEEVLITCPKSKDRSHLRLIGLKKIEEVGKS